MIVVTLLYILLASLSLAVYRIVALRSVAAESVAIERIAAFVSTGQGSVDAIGRGIARYNLAQCIAFVAEMTTGGTAEPLRIIIRYYHIESYLISMIARSRSSEQRAYLLSILARLPIGRKTVMEIEQMLGRADSNEHFFAFLCLFAAVPCRAVRLLPTIGYRLSRRDVAEMLSVVSRGSSPIPYTPLLLSDNYNMQLLGIHLVRRFGVTESRGEIVAIIKDSKSELRDDALSTLASFGEQITDTYNHRIV